MSAKPSSKRIGLIPSRLALRTWLEIDSRAAKHNFKLFRRLITPAVKLMAVVKANAYGHGLVEFSRLLDGYGADWFCVDNIIEGLALRQTGIKTPILILGATSPADFSSAADARLTITISNFAFFKTLLSTSPCPDFHLKINTGMNRQGFSLSELSSVFSLLLCRSAPVRRHLTGIYTHFASANDRNNLVYTELQLQRFQAACLLAKQAGFTNLLRHCAASGAVLASNRYHLDAVRVGLSLYGYFPSPQLTFQLSSQLRLKPVLSWKTVICETKTIPRGEFVSYDLTEKLRRHTKIAILPIGYYHGLPRSLSSLGNFIIKKSSAKILGRVTMNMTIVDITGLKTKIGDIAYLYLPDAITKSGSTPYEFLSRLNPLIKRIYL